MKFAAESVMPPRGLRRQAGLSLFIHLSIKEKVNPSLTANASLILGFFKCHLECFSSQQIWNLAVLLIMKYCELKNLDEQRSNRLISKLRRNNRKKYSLWHLQPLSTVATSFHQERLAGHTPLCLSSFWQRALMSSKPTLQFGCEHPCWGPQSCANARQLGVEQRLLRFVPCCDTHPSHPCELHFQEECIGSVWARVYRDFCVSLLWNSLWQE